MPDYNIHIHLPNEPRQDTQNESRGVMDILRRVQRCADWRSLYAMAEEFNQIGLAVVETVGSNKILCRLVDGKPLTERVVDDYIFLGADKDYGANISKMHSDLICVFISENYGPPQTRTKTVSAHHYAGSNPSLYGKPILTNNISESTLCESQFIEHIARKML